MLGTRELPAVSERELAREFTKLECGLLGAMFASVGLGFLVTMIWAVFK
jgi:hypothetical protein